MANSLRTSIIITCYQQVNSLKLLLASLKRQTLSQFEVIIADDGSNDGTRELSHLSYSFPVRYITQLDQGYRKSKILNQAIQIVRSDYIVFLDGDVLVEKHFLEDHLSLRKENHFVCGRRVDLSPSLSQKLSHQAIQNGKLDHLFARVLFSSLVHSVFRYQIPDANLCENSKRALRITHPLVRRVLGYQQPIDLLGSNFSAWKKDIEEVNGFNEAMQSYWGEDGDLYIRLRNAGKKTVNAKSMCIQYHLFHKRRAPTPEHQKLYQDLLGNLTYVRAEKGLKENQVER